MDISGLVKNFVEKHNQTFVNFDDVYGPQCMDLVRVYVRDVLVGYPQSKKVLRASEVWNHNHSLVFSYTRMLKVETGLMPL